jgi:hypothetical protein
MDMLECKDCGAENIISSQMCSDCGASLEKSNTPLDFNGDGKVDFEDFKAVFGKLKDKVSSAAVVAVDAGRDAVRSKAEKDRDAVENLADEFHKQPQEDQNEDQILCQKFKAALESTIDLKFADLMRAKQGQDKYLSYIDAQLLTASVRNIFKSALALTPPQVDAACSFSEAILAPSSQEKQNLIKATIGLAGGTAGIGLVIGGVGSALGWGAGLIATVTTAIVGTSFAGPAGWVVAGVSLAAIAGYFATTDNKQTDTERFIRVLKNANSKAVDAAWPEHGASLTSVISESKPQAQAS